MSVVTSPAIRGGHDNTVPLAPLLLGWAGVIPFGTLATALVLGTRLPVLGAGPALIGYGVAILSFMGGAQWGLAVACRATSRSWGAYSAAVVPALLAWATLAMPVEPALLVQALGFAGLLAYDLWTVHQGRSPGWYGRLRLQLSSAVVLLLLAAALLGRGP